MLSIPSIRIEEMTIDFNVYFLLKPKVFLVSLRASAELGINYKIVNFKALLPRELGYYRFQCGENL
jgi:hypothetical protein